MAPSSSSPSVTQSVTEVRHPLARHKLGLLRERTTSTADFRRLVDELTLLLTYEATKDFPTEQVEVDTPLERTTVERISGKKVAVCPVLRAGVGMLDGVLSLISGARVGFIGLYRDEETLQAVELPVANIGSSTITSRSAMSFGSFTKYSTACSVSSSR